MIGFANAVQLAPGLAYLPAYLARSQQETLLDQVRQALIVAPLFSPTMPKTGSPFSVAMSNCGSLGWLSDHTGYRYTDRHPVTRAPWPPIPAVALESWIDLSASSARPDACLINYYRPNARMGLHQDRDEDDLSAPVISLSLGDTAVFRYGGVERRHPTKSIKLESGDAVVIGGASRLAFHGIDRIVAGSSTLLDEGGRFNLTLRRVGAATIVEPLGDYL